MNIFMILQPDNASSVLFRFEVWFLLRHWLQAASTSAARRSIHFSCSKKSSIHFSCSPAVSSTRMLSISEKCVLRVLGLKFLRIDLPHFYFAMPCLATLLFCDPLHRGNCQRVEAKEKDVPVIQQCFPLRMAGISFITVILDEGVSDRAIYCARTVAL